MTSFSKMRYVRNDDKHELSFPPGTVMPLHVLAPFIPTPPDVVELMLQLGEVTSKDTIYDLGCGDGRIIIAAAMKYGARGVGLDIEPYRVAESQPNAHAAEVEHLVTFKHQDAMTMVFRLRPW